MSGIRLGAPYLDTSADALSFALGLARAGGTGHRTHPNRWTDRRVAPARRLSPGVAGPVRETVACLGDGSKQLPAAASGEFPDWNYRFTARVERHVPAEFGRRVREVRAAAEGRPDALCGVFPGEADAVTALVVEQRPGVGWRTWHTYPRTGHIVATHSRMEKS